MPTYRLDLAYDGTTFHGYARQPGLRTVQGRLEQALAHHTGPVGTIVAGRTDRGVHAIGQVVSFSTPAEIETETILRSLNSQLRDEIAVMGLRREDDDFHARYSATGRVYRYLIVNQAIHDPLRAPTSWHVGEPLDVAAMNEASTVVVGEHDFASFCRKAEGATTVRNVMWAGWRRVGHVVECSIAAHSFCHHMVRSLVSVLVDVGRERMTPVEIEEILSAADRSRAKWPAPPQGLTLVAVGYPGEPVVAPDWITSRP